MVESKSLGHKGNAPEVGVFYSHAEGANPDATQELPTNCISRTKEVSKHGLHRENLGKGHNSICSSLTLWFFEFPTEIGRDKINEYAK